MKLYTCIILFICCNTLSAQTKTSLGVIFGRSTSTFGGGSLNYSNYTKNNRIGLLFNFAPSDIFSIEPQINIEKKGAQIMLPEGQVGIRVSYIQTPLLFKLSIPIAGFIYPSIYAGPYYASSLKQTREIVNTNETEIAYTDIKIARNDIGTSLGAGVKFEIGSIFLGIDARSDYGIKKIGDIRYDAKSRNVSHSMNASLGLLF